jgi:ubiquinone/menaquinone biosynthesis C-methylase UbiE
MVQVNRWFAAQKQEKHYWENVARRISNGAISQLDWYEWRAGELHKLLAKLKIKPFSNNPKILEIGSGPIGIINYLDHGIRCAIDPLEDYYKTNPTLIKLRNNEVCYLKGSGENLPFRNGKFSLIILDNVIDHTQDPEVVLEEIYRTLDKNGIMYLSVNVHTSYGAILHKILTISKIDTKHPHTYTLKCVGKVMKKSGFTILYENVEDYREVRKKNIESGDFKSRVKGYSGLSEMIYHAVCMKE